MLKAELWHEKVRNLRDRLINTETEKRELEARRERLELPATDREMLSRVVNIGERDQSTKKAPSPPYGEEGAYS